MCSFDCACTCVLLVGASACLRELKRLSGFACARVCKSVCVCVRVRVRVHCERSCSHVLWLFTCLVAGVCGGAVVRVLVLLSGWATQLYTSHRDSPIRKSLWLSRAGLGRDLHRNSKEFAPSFFDYSPTYQILCGQLELPPKYFC